MSEVKTPSAGRIVHFFPNGKDPICAFNNATFVPAIVVQAWGNNSINIQCFTMNADAPNVLRFSVCHKTEAIKGDNGEPVQTYWDWPEMK